MTCPRSRFISLPLGNQLLRLVRKQVHLVGGPRPRIIFPAQAEVNVPAKEHAFRTGHVQGHRLAVFNGLLLLQIQNHRSPSFATSESSSLPWLILSASFQ